MDLSSEEWKTLQCCLVSIDDGHQDILRQQAPELLVFWALPGKTLKEGCAEQSPGISESAKLVSLDLPLSEQPALTSSSIFLARGRISLARRNLWQSCRMIRVQAACIGKLSAESILPLY